MTSKPGIAPSRSSEHRLTWRAFVSLARKSGGLFNKILIIASVLADASAFCNLLNSTLSSSGGAYELRGAGQSRGVYTARFHSREFRGKSRREGQSRAGARVIGASFRIGDYPREFANPNYQLARIDLHLARRRDGFIAVVGVDRARAYVGPKRILQERLLRR